MNANQLLLIPVLKISKNSSRMILVTLGMLIFKVDSNIEENFIFITGIQALNENAKSSSMSTSKTASVLPNRPSGSF